SSWAAAAATWCASSLPSTSRRKESTGSARSSPRLSRPPLKHDPLSSCLRGCGSPIQRHRPPHGRLATPATPGGFPFLTCQQPRRSHTILPKTHEICGFRQVSAPATAPISPQSLVSVASSVGSEPNSLLPRTGNSELSSRPPWRLPARCVHAAPGTCPYLSGCRG